MGDLQSAFEETVTASRLLTPVDASLVEAGRTVAAQIDYAVENCSGVELTKALYLTPHLINILREMMATPQARRAAGLSEEGPRGKLASLKPISRPGRTG